MTIEPDSASNRVEQKARERGEKLREFYRIGREANEADGGYGSKVDERFAQTYGRSVQSIGQARRFAQLVDQDELEEICGLRNLKGQAFGPGLATTLFKLKSRSDRQWALELWQNGCSSSDLKSRIDERMGPATKSKGGRKSKQPATVTEAKRQINQRGANWTGWFAQLADPDLGEVSVSDLPEEMHHHLREITRHFEELKRLTGG